MKVSRPNYILGLLALTIVVVLLFSYVAEDARNFVYNQNILVGSHVGLFNEDRKSVVSTHDFIPRHLAQNKDTSFDYLKMLDKLNQEKASMDNPVLIQIIRDYFIQLPSLKPYNLTNRDRLEYSNGQTPFVDSRLNYIEGGFYVECGALNGEKGSNSLFFEKVRKWNGLLVEADPTNFAVLKTKQRKAFIINACLSPTPYPAKMTFNKAFNRGRVVHDETAKTWIKKQRIASNPVQIQCFPLYSILQALNQSTVDYFSLDVEGDELNVLNTVPFQKLNIKMITAEVAHHSSRGKGNVQSFMEKKGYDTLLKMQRDDGGVNDIIFRKKGLHH